MKVMATLFGPYYRQIDNSDHLVGKFNAALSARVLVVVDDKAFLPNHIEPDKTRPHPRTQPQPSSLSTAIGTRSPASVFTG